MSRTRIKFCGMTRVQDAVAAANAGADAIGMVLHSNTARKISLDLARQIMNALPSFVTPVGLFVDASADQITQIAKKLHLRHVQLHGNEPASIIDQLKGFAVLKAVHISRAAITEAISPWAVTAVKGILLETANTKQAGGTGVENDWEAIEQHQQNDGFRNLPPIIAAGGLNPENVGQVVRRIKPFAVDVSSGIESAPGIKSTEKMQAFAEAVRSADQAAV